MMKCNPREDRILYFSLQVMVHYCKKSGQELNQELETEAMEGCYLLVLHIFMLS